jgi:hypothetical protein
VKAIEPDVQARGLAVERVGEVAEAILAREFPQQCRFDRLPDPPRMLVDRTEPRTLTEMEKVEARSMNLCQHACCLPVALFERQRRAGDTCDEGEE